MDAASAGAATIVQSSAPVIGTADPASAEAAQTGVDQAAEVKQNTAQTGNKKRNRH
ncbi:hypothetical protein ACRQV7_10485 [Caproiciproducens sp. R2]|uniref:hypothetical protein n=1 Tax=Caproiciproducens sp. R2 TaxID=3435187 RepID=UPI004033579C